MAQQVTVLPYAFDANNVEVVIQHKAGKYLRVNPNNQDQADGHGGRGQWARWIVELHGEKAKFKSKATGKYLRIKQGATNNSGSHIDVAGSGGKWTLFKFYKQWFKSGVIKLESAEQKGRYLGVRKDSNIKIGNGHEWTELKFFKVLGQPHHHPQPVVVQQAPQVIHRPPQQVIVQPVPQAQQGNGFVHPYLFHQRNIVVIQHKGGSGGHQHTKFLRIHPQNHAVADPNGGKGEFAQWEADPTHNGQRIRLKSCKSGKYLRIINQGQTIDVNGGGGDFTIFNVLKQNDGTVKLQSVKFPNAYLAVGGNNVVRPGNGGAFTALRIFRKTGGGQAKQPPQPQPAVNNNAMGAMFSAMGNLANVTANAIASNVQTATQHHGHQHQHGHHHQHGQNKSTCPRCKGNGWCHNSTMNHDKPPNQKCFFCGNCDSCGGKGWIQGAIRTCPKCRGNGFCHDSSMRHDKGPNQKCFWCKPCNGCSGKGR
eukprot:156617_1